MLCDIKKYREQAGLTQQELASALDLTQSAISNYELGLRLPDARMGAKLVRVFSDHGLTLTLDDIYTEKSSSSAA